MVEIRPAVASDAQTIGEMLGEAFGADPAWAQFFPDEASRPAPRTSGKLQAQPSDCSDPGVVTVMADF